MNKISKKIVALVTMAAFVLTLVPFAAFAAERSYVEIDKANQSISVEETATVTLDVASVDAGNNIVVWLTDENGVYTYATASGTEVTDGTGNFEGTAIVFSAAEKKYTINFKFDEAGTYTVHAGVDLGADAKNVNELDRELSVNGANGEPTIVVEAVPVDGMVIDNSKNVVNGELDLTEEAGYQVYANNTASKTLTVKATAKTEPVVGAEFTVSTSNSNLSVDKDTVKTGPKGTFELSYSASKAGDYVITISNDDYTAKIKVRATDRFESYPADITASLSDQATANINDVKAAADLSDYVQFVIKDQNGNELSGANAISDEPATGSANLDSNKAAYVKLVSAPEKFTGEATDFSLMWDTTDEVYTLNNTNPSDLVAGKYTVRVALYETGEYADVTFTVDKFNDNAVFDMKVVPSTDRVEYNVGKFTYKVVLVDKNGVEKEVTSQADEYYMGIDSASSVNAKFDTVDGKSGVTFTVDEKEKEEAIGTEIVLTTVSDKYSKILQTKVTVTDKNVVDGLAFDQEKGAANVNNNVKVSVVNADGDLIKGVSGNLKAYVASSSDETANVNVDVDNNVTNGKGGVLTVYADKATTLEIVVAVVTPDNKVYADTLTYTVGDQDVNADKIVAMTIGSTDMVVDNNIVTGDAAPYVADGRTMVPIRALTETFGAEVNYDNDARTVTIKDGDTTVVMTIGETTYTVNGEEKTMDVAPVIGSSDRTYVPVRFVAEALGYKVTPLYAADGTTASVVFQK